MAVRKVEKKLTEINYCGALHRNRMSFLTHNLHDLDAEHAQHGWRDRNLGNLHAAQGRNACLEALGSLLCSDSQAPKVPLSVDAVGFDCLEWGPGM